jgi:hypothetical protein
MFGFDELTAIIPPPTNLENKLTDNDWLRIFSGIGTRLPEDFVRTSQTYGPGTFYSLSHRWSASIHLHCNGLAIGGFLHTVPGRLTAIRLIKERRPKNVPFPLYWEPGGLLPWGLVSNDTDLCWRVRGNLVDNWRVVVLRAGAGQFEEFDMSAIQFLARVIAGTVKCSLLPKGFPGEKGVGFATPSQINPEHGWR